jgi:hypothetical protein
MPNHGTPEPVGDSSLNSPGFPNPAEHASNGGGGTPSLHETIGPNGFAALAGERTSVLSRFPRHFPLGLRKRS